MARCFTHGLDFIVRCRCRAWSGLAPSVAAFIAVFVFAFTKKKHIKERRAERDQKNIGPTLKNTRADGRSHLPMFALDLLDFWTSRISGIIRIFGVVATPGPWVAGSSRSGLSRAK